MALENFFIFVLCQVVLSKHCGGMWDSTAHRPQFTSYLLYITVLYCIFANEYMHLQIYTKAMYVHMEMHASTQCQLVSDRQARRQMKQIYGSWYGSDRATTSFCEQMSWNNESKTEMPNIHKGLQL